MPISTIRSHNAFFNLTSIAMKPLIAVILVASFAPTISHAGPCGQDVTQFQEKVRRDDRRPSAGATSQQTTAAQLHRQPTPQSIKEGLESAQAAFVAVLQRARAADEAGDEAECRKALREAMDMFDPL